MNKNSYNLSDIAYQAMLDNGLVPEFPPEVLAQVIAISGPAQPSSDYRDMRDKMWISIDNDDSRDLDQLTYAESVNANEDHIFTAIADVDSLVKKGDVIDKYASHNTTSVYTPTRIFPMLPLKLSTDYTSLNEHTDRCAIVVEMKILKNGQFDLVDIYKAFVRNHAKLAYNAVGKWLEANEFPAEITAMPGVVGQLTLQNKIAQRIKSYRYDQGALVFANLEVQPVIVEGTPVGLTKPIVYQSNELIENFMIASNTGMTKYLASKKQATVRRVVRTPKRWDRIVELAGELGVRLPDEPDVKALQGFLVLQQKTQPDKFADLSLTIIKLVGKGEYVVALPGEVAIGHFDLALLDYAHTTAPNRRYPDLIMQRILKYLLENKPAPYTNAELKSIAYNCTEKEDAATKVERRVRKSAAAMVLANQIGKQFSAIVVGAGDKGTWVRLKDLPIEGKLSRGYEGVDVGDEVQVKLVHVDVQKGFIDFFRV